MKTITENSIKLLILCYLLIVAACKPEELAKTTKVQTGDIDSITYNSARAEINIIDIGGAISEFGHCWNITGNPTVSDLKNTISGTAQKGIHTSKLTGLTGNTTYYVRAYAEDEKGVIYGDEANFKTELSPSITITSPTAIDHWIGNEQHLITWTSVNVSGNVNISLYKSGTYQSGLFTDIQCSLGEKAWTIPETQVYGKDYTIRVISADNNSIYGECQAFTCSEKTGTTGSMSYVGHEYNLIKIGKQWWMATNLKAGNYNDDSAIPKVTNATNWSGLTSPAYCIYNNDDPNRTTFGCLYNWYAIDPASNGNKNICPVGWHVPTDTEWGTMEIYLQNHDYNFNGTIDTDNDRSTNNYIAKALAATTNWQNNSTVGAPGNTDYSTYRNKSGFSALASGFRATDGSYQSLNTFNYFWSSSAGGTGKAWHRYIWNQEVFIDRYESNIKYGYTARCIKD